MIFSIDSRVTQGITVYIEEIIKNIKGGKVLCLRE